MNKDVRRYFNGLGLLYKRFISGGGYFGVRVFTIIDEYYFNDKHYDTQYKVGLNLGKFKSLISQRAEIEVTLYTKEALILVDHISKMLTIAQDGEITCYTQKTFCYRDKGNLKLEVEALVLIKRRNINDYAFGIVYRDLNGEIIDKFQVDLDRYDLIELHNLLKSFSQIAYNLIINLAVSDFYSNVNAETKAKQNISVNSQTQFTDQIPNNVEIPISVENVEETELNIDEIDSFGLRMPNLTSIDIKFNKDVKPDQITELNLETVKDKVIEVECECTQQDNDSESSLLESFKNDLFDGEYEEISEDENDESLDTENSNLSTNTSESNNLEKDNDVSINTNNIQEDNSIDDNKQETVNKEDNTYSTDLDKLYQKFGKPLVDIIINNYDYVVNEKNNTLVLKEIDPQTQMVFEQTLKKAIDTISKYNLSAFHIKPAFIFLFFNSDIREILKKLNISTDNRGLYYLLQALLVKNRTKSDDILFGQEITQLMKEKVEEMLDILNQSYKTRLDDNSKYHELLNQHF